MGNPPSFDNFATDPLFTNDVNNVRPTAHPGQPELPGWHPHGDLWRRQWTERNGAAATLAASRHSAPYTNWTWTDSFNDNLSKVRASTT